MRSLSVIVLLPGNSDYMRCALIIWFLLGGAFFVPYAQASSGETPRYGIFDIFPLGWSQDGVKRGVLVEIAQAFDLDMGIKSEITIVPLRRGVVGQRAGFMDFTFLYNINGEVKGAEYAVDVFCMRPAIISFETFPVTQLSDLAGKSVSYIGGAVFHFKYVDKLDFSFTRVPLVDPELMLKMVLAGRLDVAIASDVIWEGYTNGVHPVFSFTPKQVMKFAEPYYLPPVPFSLTVSNKSKFHHLRPEFVRLMALPKFRGALQKIYDKYRVANATDCFRTVPK